MSNSNKTDLKHIKLNSNEINESEDYITARFLQIGLEQKNTLTLVKNQKLTQNMLNVIDEAGIKLGQHCNKKIGNFLLQVATKIPKDHLMVEQRPLLCQYICESKIKTQVQLNSALSYFRNHIEMDIKEFEEFCGIGIVVTEDQIREAVLQILSESKGVLTKRNVKWHGGKMLAALSSRLKQADSKVRKKIFDEELEQWLNKEILDDEEEFEDENINTLKTESINQSVSKESDRTQINKQMQGRQLPQANNSAEIFDEHIKRTSGIFRTRFPPEPNGFLHIGHAKAMNFNFNLADSKNGWCYLRYDDTNPTVEEHIYVDNILENVKWLGFKPAKVTYSSDYFKELYELAQSLIKKGYAYVCHQTQEEIRESRDNRIKNKEICPSPQRDRSVEENLELFEQMKNGKFDAGKATLRMKGDLKHSNPNMQDPIAYRIINSPHPRTDNKQCIYPSYDFTHCVVDSLEDIDASCCTLEFEIRRESYFQLLDVLDIYKPVVQEYSRLNLEYNVLSKRYMLKLVNDGYVRGQDDPRLLTINGLRRRGYPSSAINDFCSKIGVTRSSNYISPLLLESCARENLDMTSIRAMCVLEPLKVILENFDENKIEMIQCFNFPHNHFKGKHEDPLSRTIYIDEKDFRMDAPKNFFGMKIGKVVRLKYACNVLCKDAVIDPETGKIKHIVCEIASDQETKVKRGHLHWIGQKNLNEPLKRVEFRLYENLFKTKRPGKSDEEIDLEDNSNEDKESELKKENKDAQLNDLNPNSLVIKHGYVSYSAYERSNQQINKQHNRKKVESIKSQSNDKTEEDKALPPWECAYQFERVGYFCLDVDSSVDNLVFNQTIPLRESNTKKNMGKKIFKK